MGKIVGLPVLDKENAILIYNLEVWKMQVVCTIWLLPIYQCPPRHDIAKCLSPSELFPTDVLERKEEAGRNA